MMAARCAPAGAPRRVVSTAHRWLGLASGAVVFVVALTGALYAFAPEITGPDYSRPVRLESGHVAAGSLE
jgi:uncharacterized iron-regulated membrane protein